MPPISDVACRRGLMPATMIGGSRHATPTADIADTSTSPLRPVAFEAMLPFLRDHHADPGRLHAEGRVTRVALEDAREQVAALLGARPREVVFTASGTEAVNTAVWGAVARADAPAHIVTTGVEHSAVLDACRRSGAEVSVAVSANGKSILTQKAAADRGKLSYVAGLRPPVAGNYTITETQPTNFYDGSPHTISLLSGLPAVSDSLTLTGPGSTLLTVRRDATATGSFGILALGTAPGHRKSYLRWLTVTERDDVRLITVDEICYFRSDNKYTIVVTPQQESLIRRSIKELIEEVDPKMFLQIHRGTLVNANAIAGITRDFGGRLWVMFKERKEKLPVSEPYVHLFNRM